MSESLRLELERYYRPLGKSLDLCGALLLAPEGLNATIAGTPEAVNSFFQDLVTRFPALKASDTSSEREPFKKWKVLQRRRLVDSGCDTPPPPSNKNGQKSPREWDEILALVRKGEAQMIDVRNAYEIQLGTFPEATNPNTSTFKEFAGYLDAEVGSGLDPNLPTAIFCTGGIRCE